MVLDEAVDSATAVENLPLLARAELMRLLLKVELEPAEEWSGSWRASRQHRGGAEQAERPRGPGRRVAPPLACLCRGWPHGESAEVAARAIEYATLAGDERQRRIAASHYAQVATYGPTPVPEAIAKCEEILTTLEGDMRTGDRDRPARPARGDERQLRARALALQRRSRGPGGDGPERRRRLDVAGLVRVEMLAGVPRRPSGS